MRTRIIIAVAFAAVLSTLAVARPFQGRDRGAESPAPQVDRIFSKWDSTSTPGCAVGAAVDGKPVIAKGYGMADLEHDVKITPDSVFEAGSVSKQFTAAAILLLAREGKVSIDDPVRKYIPELPDYPPPPDANGSGSGAAAPKPEAKADGSPLTIRHMLNHTSGLRDWGSIEAIAGWPRTSRAYTHAHVLEIVSHQKALNFTPGTKWSYSNTGFNLAAIIVSRVSGVPFAEFTRQRLFEPLGMTHTSWRDDFTRILKNRAIAYSDRSGEFHTDMPFENVHGNGGLLTTVGDLLKWNENFTSPKVGDAAFVAMQQQPGRFNDGRPHGYAFGLMVNSDKGVRVVEHSGSTAGYSAHLIRYPDQHVSVAVLCNATSARATQYAHDVAWVLLRDRATPAADTAARELAHEDGVLYRNINTGVVLINVRGGTWTQEGNRIRVTDEYGSVEIYERAKKAAPTPTQLQELAGTYVSDEAETTLVAAVDGGSLVLKRRPDTVITLTPQYADAFTGPQLGLVIFRRDASGRVSAMTVNQDRVWDLRFARQPSPVRPSQ
jgi:CubicO group peptidase (beta-lactamase class C family)